MTRTQIIALLNKHGVTVDDKATDEQVVALLETTLGDLKAKAEKPPETPATDPTDKTADRLAALEAKAEKERVARITADVTALCAERRIDPADWIFNCLGNDTVIAALRKLPVVETSKPLALGAPQNKALTLTEQCKIANGIK